MSSSARQLQQENTRTPEHQKTRREGDKEMKAR
jgi:hypothetical protein